LALIVEDGTGIANAESLCSVAFADAFLDGIGQASWALLTTTSKEQALRRATLYMQQVYRMRWAGDRVTTTQALDWPRVGVPRRDVGSWGAWGYYGGFVSEYASNVVPSEVQQACAKLAYKAVAGDLSPDLSQAKTRVKVGPIETEYLPGSVQYVRYREIDNLLSPFMNMGGSMIPVTRA